MLKSLQNISTSELISALKSMNNSENKTLAEVVLYLSEIDSRRAFVEFGYSSLFCYCTEALGYSESAAWRRILVARSLKANPDIYESISSGKLSLCALVEICKVKEEQSKQELLKASEGKSKREVQALTAKYQPVTLRTYRFGFSPYSLTFALRALFCLFGRGLMASQGEIKTSWLYIGLSE